MDDLQKQRRQVFFTTVLSTTCTLVLIVALPLFHMHIQRVKTQMLADVDYCKDESRDLWKQLMTQGAGAKRQTRQAGYGNLAAALGVQQGGSCE